MPMISGNSPIDKLTRTLQNEKYMKLPVHFDSRLFGALRSNLEVSVRRLGHIIGKLKNKPNNEPTLAYLKKKWKSNDKIVLKLVNRLNAVKDGDTIPGSDISKIETHLGHADDLVKKFKDSIDPSSKKLFDQALKDCRAAIEQLKAQAKLAQEATTLTPTAEVSPHLTRTVSAETIAHPTRAPDTDITSEMYTEPRSENLDEADFATMEPPPLLRRTAPAISPITHPVSHAPHVMEVEAPVNQRQAASQEKIPEAVREIIQEYTNILTLFDQESLQPLKLSFQAIIDKDLDKLKVELQSIEQTPDAIAAFTKKWEEQARFLKGNVKEIEKSDLYHYADVFSQELSEKLISLILDLNKNAEKKLIELKKQTVLIPLSNQKELAIHINKIQKLEQIVAKFKYDIKTIGVEQQANPDSIKLHKEKLNHIQQYWRLDFLTELHEEQDLPIIEKELNHLKQLSELENHLFQFFKASKEFAISTPQNLYLEFIKQDEFSTAYQLEDEMNRAGRGFNQLKLSFNEDRTLRTAAQLFIIKHETEQRIETFAEELERQKTISSTKLLQQAENLKDKDASLSLKARQRFIECTQEAQKQLLESAQAKLQAYKKESKSTLALEKMITDIQAAELPATSKVKVVGFHIMGGKQVKLPSATHEQLRAWEKQVNELQLSYEALTK